MHYYLDTIIPVNASQEGTHPTWCLISTASFGNEASCYHKGCAAMHQSAWSFDYLGAITPGGQHHETNARLLVHTTCAQRHDCCASTATDLIEIPDQPHEGSNVTQHRFWAGFPCSHVRVAGKLSISKGPAPGIAQHAPGLQLAEGVPPTPGSPWHRWPLELAPPDRSAAPPRTARVRRTGAPRG